MNKKNILNYILIFLVVYLILSYFFNPTKEAPVSEGNFNIVTEKGDYEQNNLVSVKITNNTDFTAVVDNACPLNPLSVLTKKAGQWESISASANIDCNGDYAEQYKITPHNSTSIQYAEWNHELFNEIGVYKIIANINVPENSDLSTVIETNEFEIKPLGWFGIVWTSAFYQPIYNALIYLTSVVPNHDLGLAIIILTLIIRTILLIPAQKSMKSQRRLQEVQPKLKKIQEKYKGNQEMIASETMKLWKEHKVNPFGSCLPLLIQLPFLIAIFYVIKTGLSPNNTYLLYEPLQYFQLTAINTNFLGILELTKINILVLPLIVGGLQFLQMKLAMARAKTKKEADDKGKKEKNKNEMEMANQMMVYFMPIMIALFTASMPAGVGIYWSTSTLYGLIQQLVVNKQLENEKTKVKVIKK